LYINYTSFIIETKSENVLETKRAGGPYSAQQPGGPARGSCARSGPAQQAAHEGEARASAANFAQKPLASQVIT
jgi:hypothetical protein